MQSCAVPGVGDAAAGGGWLAVRSLHSLPSQFCDQCGTTWDDSENDREVAQDDDGFEVLAATERYPDVELTQSDMEGES